MYMANTIRAALTRSLDQINWDASNNEACAEAAELLRNVGPERLLRIVRHAVSDVLEHMKDELAWNGFSRNIVTRPSHVKYRIGGTDHFDGEGYTLWAHYFKNLPEGPFVDTLHNHRYALAAGPLTTPYRAREWRCSRTKLLQSELWIPSKVEWANPEVREYQPGETWAMSALDIHSLHIVNPNTQSVVIQGPLQRDGSYTFDEATGGVLDYFPSLNAELAPLLGELSVRESTTSA